MPGINIYVTPYAEVYLSENVASKLTAEMKKVDKPLSRLMRRITKASSLTTTERKILKFAEDAWNNGHCDGPLVFGD